MAAIETVINGPNRFFINPPVRLVDKRAKNRLFIYEEQNKQAFIDYVQEVVSFLNESIKDSYSIRFCGKALVDQIRRASSANSNVCISHALEIFHKTNTVLDNDIPDDPGGKIRKTSAEGFANVIKIFLGEDLHINLCCPMQGGKSIASLLIACFLPVTAYLIDNNNLLQPVYAIPNQDSLFGQIKNDFYSFWCLNSLIQVINTRTKEAITPFEFFANFYELTGAYENESRGAVSIFYKNAKPSSSIKKNLDNKNTGALAARLQSIKDKNFTPLLIDDEADFGSNIEGVKSTNYARSAILSLHEIEETKTRYIAVSATGFEYTEKEGFRLAVIPVDKGFTGITCYGGLDIPCLTKNCVISPPEIRDYRSHFSLDYIIDADAFYKKSKFVKKYTELTGKLKRDNKDFNQEHVKYQKYVVDSVYEMIMKISEEKGNYNSPGISIRFGNNESIALLKILLEEKAKQNNTEIMFCPFFGDSEYIFQSAINNHIPVDPNKKEITVKDIVPRAKTGDPFVLLLTGRGRMGEQFPSNIKTGIDFTLRGSTVRSDLQGTFGRLCGWNKGRTVFYGSEVVVDTILDYIKSKGHPQDLPRGKKLAWRSDMGIKKKSGRPGYRVDFYIEPAIERAKTLQTDVARKLINIVNDMKRIFNKTHRPGDKKYGGTPENSRELKGFFNLLAHLLSENPYLITDAKGYPLFADGEKLKLMNIPMVNNDVELDDFISNEFRNAATSPYFRIEKEEPSHCGLIISRRATGPTSESYDNHMKNQNKSGIARDEQSLKGNRSIRMNNARCNRIDPHLWFYDPHQEVCKTQCEEQGIELPPDCRLIALTLPTIEAVQGRVNVSSNGHIGYNATKMAMCKNHNEDTYE